MASSSARRVPRPSNARTDKDGGAPGVSGSHRFSYVLDTSVLLADPAAISRFAEHRVIIPIVVITGLNAEATRLVVESWTPERGLRRVERD